MIPAPSRSLTAFGGLVLFGFLWGTTIPQIKIAVSTGHGLLGLIFWQFAFSALLLGAIVAARGDHTAWSKRHLVYYLAIALLGTILPNGFSLLATRHLPAGIMAIFIATVPMFSLCIALLAGNERLVWRRVLGIGLGVTAMVLIALPEARLPGMGNAVWMAIALIAPLCYGLEGNFVAKQAPRDINAIATLFGASVAGAIVVAPLAWFSGGWVDLSNTWTLPEYALLGSSLAHAIAYAGYVWLVGYAGVVFTSQIAYVITLTAIATAMLILGETYSSFIWLAILLILVGLSLVKPGPAVAPPDTR